MTKLLTVWQVVELLSISRSNLYALIWKGQITSIKIGKKRLFREEWIEEFLRRNTYRASCVESPSNHL
jgi:excisionase family DNA binding protein